MKTKILILIAGIILLGACSNKFDLTKRKYNKGYYFSICKNVPPNKLKNNQKVTVSDYLQNNDVVLYKHESSLNNQKNPIELNTTVLKHFEANSKKKSNMLNDALVSANNKNIHVPKPILKPISNLSIKKYIKKSQTSDTDLLIQIILSLFPIICLIAVYLHDGKTITLNFFIDLLLHLTFIGAMVFALLVVFDVVDLK